MRAELCEARRDAAEAAAAQAGQRHAAQTASARRARAQAEAASGFVMAAAEAAVRVARTEAEATEAARNAAINEAATARGQLAVQRASAAATNGATAEPTADGDDAELSLDWDAAGAAGATDAADCEAKAFAVRWPRRPGPLRLRPAAHLKFISDEEGAGPCPALLVAGGEGGGTATRT